MVSLFERIDQNVSCPFGPDYCGTGPHCPMHYDMLRVRERLVVFLKTNSFARFVGWTQPADPQPVSATATKRL